MTEASNMFIFGLARRFKSERTAERNASARLAEVRPCSVNAIPQMWLKQKYAGLGPYAVERYRPGVYAVVDELGYNVAHQDGSGRVLFRCPGSAMIVAMAWNEKQLPL